MNLARFVQILELRYPKLFAASWDNVGLLVNPSNVQVKNILLANDFTKAVLNEAKSKCCNLIICYHPVIFRGIKALDVDSENKDALCLDALLNRIAIYCPHTILDTVADGVNDWLIGCFGDLEDSIIRSVRPFDHLTKHYQSVVSVDVTKSLEKLCSPCAPKFYVFQSNNRNYIFSDLNKMDERWYNYLDVIETDSIAERLHQNTWGDGRVIERRIPLSITHCVEIVKKHLRIPHVLLASSNQLDPFEENIKTIAVCAGSGGNVLRGVDADVVITGELDHHSVLEFVEKGTHVIVTNHSNSERGFLDIYAHQITHHLACFDIARSAFPRILVSEADCDPFRVV